MLNIYSPMVTQTDFLQYYFHIRALQQSNDSTWDIVCYNKAVDSSVLGVRHIQFDPKNRKVKKNNLSIIPKLYPRRISYDTPLSSTILSGRDYFNLNFVDQDEFVINQVSDSIYWDNKRAIYDIKNFDFSPLPTYPSTCDQGFFLDTLPLSYSYPAGLLTDTTLSLTPVLDSSLVIDSIIPSYNIPTQTYTTEFGLLIARFKPNKDSSCMTPLDLRSDTSLKSGTSMWYIHYLSFGIIDSFAARDSIGYRAIYSGRIKITHTHRLNNCSDIHIDTVFKQWNRKPYTSRDTFLCPPINYTLAVPYYQGVFYLWQPSGDNTHYTTITDTGTYRLTLSNSCMLIEDTIRVTTSPILQFASDSITLCRKYLPYTLSSPVISSSIRYTWNNVVKDSLSSILVKNYGWQRLKIQTACTLREDSILIDSPHIVIPIHPDSIDLCGGVYKIYKPFPASAGVTLEEKTVVNSVPLWLNRDSLTLTKNQKIVFRYTDSCGAVTVDSIYDYNRGVFPNLNLSPNTTLCEVWDTKVINKTVGIKQYEFMNSWLQKDTIILKLGLNIIKREDVCGNQALDSTYGIQIRPVSNLLPDTIDICTRSFPQKLGVIGSFKNYLWSTGSTKDTLSIPAQGSYKLTVDDGCMYQYDEVYARELKSITETALTEDRKEFCLSVLKARIETPLVYPSYIWNSVSTANNYIRIDTSYTLVRLAIPRVCDTLRDSMVIDWVNPILSAPLYTIDSSYCSQPEAAVRVTLTNPTDYSKYAWNGDTNSLSFYINSYKPNRFYAQNLCYTREFTIPAFYCPLSPVGLPTAFSPNGDGRNDVWRLNGTKGIKIHALSVYNRWGEKVYETTDPNFQWAGDYKGQLLPIGIYSYILDYEYMPQRSRREYTGTVTVVR
jgi:gliding motility-associated-like protein